MEILKYTNWLDIVGVIIVLRCIYLGAKTGLTAELFRFVGSVLALAVGVHWYGQAAEIIIVNLSLPAWLSQFLCFSVIVLLVRIVFRYSVLVFLKVLNLQFVPQLEKGGGALVGFGRGIVMFGVLVLSLTFIPSDYMTDSIFNGSLSGTFVVKAMERTYKSLTFWVPESNIEKNIFSIPATKKKG
jgi:uncharacterized membrane protein required for colicin V production